MIPTLSSPVGRGRLPGTRPVPVEGLPVGGDGPLVPAVTPGRGDRVYFPTFRTTRPPSDAPTFTELVARYCFEEDG